MSSNSREGELGKGDITVKGAKITVEGPAGTKVEAQPNPQEGKANLKF